MDTHPQERTYVVLTHGLLYNGTHCLRIFFTTESISIVYCELAVIANSNYLYHHGGHYSLLSTRFLYLVTVITCTYKPMRRGGFVGCERTPFEKSSGWLHCIMIRLPLTNRVSAPPLATWCFNEHVGPILVFIIVYK